MENQNQIENIQSDEAMMESPQTEFGTMMTDESPEIALARIEKVAELAPRWEAALRVILVASTFPQDWQNFSGKMCLGSAGAMRVGKHFPIRYESWTCEKETFEDEHGKGYRYIYMCDAVLGARRVFCQGNYSTRDKFLGFADDEWRNIADIPEGNIRNAAYHICLGNAIKELLGLRAIPVEELQKIMKSTGQDAKKTGSHSYNNGSQGGTDPKDHEHQVELSGILLDLANRDYVITVDDKAKPMLTANEFASSDPNKFASDSCFAISSFWAQKDDKVVGGKNSPRELKGQRLNISLAKAKELAETLEQN